MDEKVIRFVPDWTEDRKQVLLHFAASAPDAKNEYVNKPQERKYTPSQFVETTRQAMKQEIDVGFGQCVELIDGELVDKEEIEQDRQLELSVKVLTDELDSLERICGSNVLGEIFFETHDKHNAVTNSSSKYPEVRKRLEKLYDTYGFDLLYEQLEL
jgi:hypothetical protein